MFKCNMMKQYNVINHSTNHIKYAGAYGLLIYHFEKIRAFQRGIIGSPSFISFKVTNRQSSRSRRSIKIKIFFKRQTFVSKSCLSACGFKSWTRDLSLIENERMNFSVLELFHEIGPIPQKSVKILG